ncbi:tagaturonate reductase [Caloramator sp. E03]|uniref:tagaturonate reductase n=1 Tax=Caloramator sp. E03 TaxID=2576307 RepID=UPI001110F0A4|nr:tagaturonate reductase [Caloramator sp. E03]
MKVNISNIKTKNNNVEKILQFGEGNFLRAFVDWMINRLNETGNFEGSVVVVQPLENGMVEKLNEQNGLYTVILKGIENENEVYNSEVVKSISRGINPYKNFDEYEKLSFSESLKIIISNTTEAGIYFDETEKLEDKPQKSYVGKLTALLYKRFKHFNGDLERGFYIIPCELIEKNGEKLRETILKYAYHWNLGDDFINWLLKANIFYNSLVDRIVPGFPKDNYKEVCEYLGYEDNLIVECEPFHLWVIEGPKKIKEVLPFEKSNLNVLVVDDLTPYRTRKVRILNGAHTLMVPVAMLSKLETVRESVEDELIGRYVKETIFNEIVPVIDLPENELKEFSYAVLERFKNPFIKHYLLSIALNSISKFETRVLPTLIEYRNNKGCLPKNIVFSLASLILFYKGKGLDGSEIKLNDSEFVLDFFNDVWKDYNEDEKSLEDIAKKVLMNKDFWKMDLTKIEGLTKSVAENMKNILKLGIREALSNLR